MDGQMDGYFYLFLHKIWQYDDINDICILNLGQIFAIYIFIHAL